VQAVLSLEALRAPIGARSFRLIAGEDYAVGWGAHWTNVERLHRSKIFPTTCLSTRSLLPEKALGPLGRPERTRARTTRFGRAGLGLLRSRHSRWVCEKVRCRSNGPRQRGFFRVAASMQGRPLSGRPSAGDTILCLVVFRWEPGALPGRTDRGGALRGLAHGFAAKKNQVRAPTGRVQGRGRESTPGRSCSISIYWC